MPPGEGSRGRIEFRTFSDGPILRKSQAVRFVADACNRGDDGPRTQVDQPYRSARRGGGIQPGPAIFRRFFLRPIPKNNGNKGTAAATRGSKPAPFGGPALLDVRRLDDRAVFRDVRLDHRGELLGRHSARSMPMPFSFSFVSGAFMARKASWYSRDTIAAGVPAGANRPAQ